MDNPALRPAVWEGNKRIPVDFPLKVRQGLANTGDLLAMVPEDFKFSVQTPDVAYVVERGDSLSVIAGRFDTSVSRLVALNQLSNRHRIQIGQRLLLPQGNTGGQQFLSSIQASTSEDGIYTVRRGDTVSLIAARYGVTEQSLLGNNGKVEVITINCSTERLDGFSGHSDYNQLMSFVQRLRPKLRLSLIHI